MTALALPPYMRGRNATAAIVTPQSVSNAGVLTAGTPKDLIVLGVFDTWEFNGNLNGTDIHPTNGGCANYVGSFDDFEVKLGEIDRNNALSVLMQVWGSNTIIRIEADTSDDTGVASSVFAVMLTRAGGSISHGIVEEKNGTILTLKPCGILPYYGTGTPPF